MSEENSEMIDSMASEIYFTNIEDIGNLYLDCVLLSFENEPILFVCKSDEKALYLCLCSEFRHIRRWTISKTDAATLLSMIENNITIYTALEKNGISKWIINSDGSMVSSLKVLFTDLDAINLPDKTAYLNIRTGEFYNYLKNNL